MSIKEISFPGLERLAAIAEAAQETAVDAAQNDFMLGYLSEIIVAASAILGAIVGAAIQSHLHSKTNAAEFQRNQISERKNAFLLAVDFISESSNCITQIERHLFEELADAPPRPFSWLNIRDRSYEPSPPQNLPFACISLLIEHREFDTLTLIKNHISAAQSTEHSLRTFREKRKQFLDEFGSKLTPPIQDRSTIRAAKSIDEFVTTMLSHLDMMQQEAATTRLQTQRLGYTYWKEWGFEQLFHGVELVQGKVGSLEDADERPYMHMKFDPRRSTNSGHHNPQHKD